MSVTVEPEKLRKSAALMVVSEVRIDGSRKL